MLGPTGGRTTSELGKAEHPASTAPGQAGHAGQPGHGGTAGQRDAQRSATRPNSELPQAARRAQSAGGMAPRAPL